MMYGEVLSITRRRTEMKASEFSWTTLNRKAFHQPHLAAVAGFW